VGSGLARARGERELLALARRADAYSSSLLNARADRSSITRGVPRWAPLASTYVTTSATSSAGRARRTSAPRAADSTASS
jgi:hypothetical protein